MKNVNKDIDILKDLIGCRIDTHYHTGGIVIDASRPYKDGFYTITYKECQNSRDKCWINTIKVENGVVTCEGIPLKISGKPAPRQLSLFD